MKRHLCKHIRVMHSSYDAKKTKRNIQPRFLPAHASHILVEKLAEPHLELSRKRREVCALPVVKLKTCQQLHRKCNAGSCEGCSTGRRERPCRTNQNAGTSALRRRAAASTVAGRGVPAAGTWRRERSTRGVSSPRLATRCRPGGALHTALEGLPLSAGL